MMLISTFMTAVPSVSGDSSQEHGGIVSEAIHFNEKRSSTPSTNTPFTYPAGSTVVSMPGTQSPLEIRQAYKYMFNRIYEQGDVEWAAGAFSVDGSPMSAGTFLSLSEMEGEFNYTHAVNPFSITQAYSLHPVKIALFSANTTDIFGQIITWEEGYFERIFKTYLWGDYFDTVTESDISGGALSDYDVLILPAITSGYITALESALGPTGLNNIASFVNGGGTLYAQGDSCHVAQAASLVPSGTVNTATRISATGNTATTSVSITTSPLTWSWQTNNLYILDDPLLVFEAGRPILERMVESGQPCVVDDLAAEVGGEQASRRLYGLQSAVAVPVGPDNNRLLVAYGEQPDGSFSPREKQAVLEAADLRERTRTLVMLTNMSIEERFDGAFWQSGECIIGWSKHGKRSFTFQCFH